MFIFIYGDNDCKLTKARKEALHNEIDNCIKNGYTKFFLSTTNNFCKEAHDYLTEKLKTNDNLNIVIYYKSNINTIFANIPFISSSRSFPYIEEYEYDLAKECDYMISLISLKNTTYYTMFLSLAKNHKNLF